jgi:hypothetical protein
VTEGVEADGGLAFDGVRSGFRFGRLHCDLSKACARAGNANFSLDWLQTSEIEVGRFCDWLRRGSEKVERKRLLLCVTLPSRARFMAELLRVRMLEEFGFRDGSAVQGAGEVIDKALAGCRVVERTAEAGGLGGFGEEAP